MARARNIKPSFFLNEELTEIDPLGRLLFIGLWCLADRAGRLEDRPKRIKIELLPCDDCDVDALLQALHDRGLIQRYMVAEHRLIQVANFAKHQSPHHQERESRLPAPASLEATGERARGRPKASPGFIPDKPETSPGAIALIPDSLIPDSLKKDMSGKPDPNPARNPKPKADTTKCRQLLDYLNAKTGKAFRPGAANLSLVSARLKDATPDEIRAVINAKVAEWAHDAKMAKYLRPETLFNATKFASYLGEIGTTGPSANLSAWWELSGFSSESHAIDDGCQQWNWREFSAGTRIEGVTA